MFNFQVVKLVIVLIRWCRQVQLCKSEGYSMLPNRSVARMAGPARSTHCWAIGRRRVRLTRHDVSPLPTPAVPDTVHKVQVHVQLHNCTVPASRTFLTTTCYCAGLQFTSLHLQSWSISGQPQCRFSQAQPAQLFEQHSAPGLTCSTHALPLSDY